MAVTWANGRASLDFAFWCEISSDHKVSQGWISREHDATRAGHSWGCSTPEPGRVMYEERREAV